MSILVAVKDLGHEIVKRGPACFVTTVGPNGAPKIHHGTVAWVADTGHIVAVVGKGSALNAADRPHVTLLWPAPVDDPDFMHLLVDATAVATNTKGDDVTITVEPTGAIRHRIVG